MTPLTGKQKLSSRETEVGDAKKIFFRADGNHRTGYGHIIRCIAMAEMLQPEFDIYFISKHPDDFIQKQINKVAGLISLEENLAVEAELEKLHTILKKDDIIVLDSYHFDTPYREAVKKMQVKLICIEDIPTGFYPADMIVCPNPLVRQQDFSAPAETVFCMGLSYALLRKPFREAVVQSTEKKGALVAMGGTDSFGITPVVAEQLLGCAAGAIHIIYTNGFKDEVISRLEQLHRQHPDRIVLHANISSVQVRDIMDTVIQAFVSASGILVEALSRNLQIFAGYYADNQQGFYNWLTAEKLIYPLGDMRLAFNCCDKEVQTTVRSFKGLNLKTAGEWKQIIRLIS